MKMLSDLFQPCPNCSGTGKLPGDEVNPENKCRRCDGSGKILSPAGQQVKEVVALVADVRTERGD